MFTYLAGQVGIAVFAVTGVLAAGHRNLDLFAVVVIGVVTAVGGGTVRDMVLGVPVFWVHDFTYVTVALVATVVAFALDQRLQNTYNLLLYLDGLACALFTVLAIEKTLALGHTSPVAVVMGIVTGIGGGLIRDVLIGEPTLLARKELYATPILLGGLLYAGLILLVPAQGELAALAAALAIFVMRAVAIRFGLAYPAWLTVRPRT
jgi:uncharacterized membrane protein YeiH